MRRLEPMNAVELNDESLEQVNGGRVNPLNPNYPGPDPRWQAMKEANADQTMKELKEAAADYWEQVTTE